MRGRTLGHARRPRGWSTGRAEARRAARGGRSVTLRLFIPGDAGAVAVGSDEVAVALRDAASRYNASIEIVRNGSRGLYWLEPLVEVLSPGGRVAYGPVTAADAASILGAAVSGRHD